MDLTPSTPAARVIDEVVPMGQGVHDRQAMMNNLGVHAAMYQEDEADAGYGEIAYVEGARPSPLWLDLSIGGLGTLIAYMVLRRFI